MSTDYNSTLNLPKTDFPMRASLPENEPGTLEYWEENGIYEKIMKNNKEKQHYIVHDGPPYANGDIHLGHALNKVLKDIIVKFKNMNGFKAPFVPGWDTHGLPTEIKARTKFGAEKSKLMSDIELRGLCKEFAIGYVEKQKNGVFIELTPNLVGMTEYTEKLEYGQTVDVCIKKIVPDKRKIKLIIVYLNYKEGFKWLKITKSKHKYHHLR